MEIVLQGPLSGYSIETAKIYIKSRIAERVILSCWENDDKSIVSDDENIIILRNKDVENPSIVNVNRQIKSSFSGLKLVESNICMRLRGDQRISVDSIKSLQKFFNERYETNSHFYYGGGPRGKIAVCGIFKPYPFHPRDHMFLGYTEDLLNFFDIPMCNTIFNNSYKGEDQYVNCLRAETYLGQFYYAKFDKNIEKMIQSPQEYIFDNAPKIHEAIKASEELNDKIFQLTPELEIEWPKYGYNRYPNSVNAHREYTYGTL